jgi:tRNA-splicing ligase RtcB
LPYLCKILGFIFGDGTVRFDPRSGKGIVAFYGGREDLEDIRADLLQLNISPSRIWQRERHHSIRTTYREYEFNHHEVWFTVSSTSLAALLAILGAPLGRKTDQDYVFPAWLWKAPLWQKRLFLAAFFGAELTTPRTVSHHGCNLASPIISMNKHYGYEASGQVFLEEIAACLAEFGIATRPIQTRREQNNPDGSYSIRLRLIITANAQNLIRLWNKISYEYNRKRRTLAAVAIAYLTKKQRRTEDRQEIAKMAAVMADSGSPPSEIYAELAGSQANRRFIERSLYEGRRTLPRIGNDFPTFTAFRLEATEGLGASGMVWDRVAEIKPVDYEGRVYDFSMDHPGHNFIANGFVVSNCGVRLLASQIDVDRAEPLMGDLASALNHYCPSGVGTKGHLALSDKELDQVCREGSRWALKKGYATQYGVRRRGECCQEGIRKR